MTITELVGEAYETAKEKGWHGTCWNNEDESYKEASSLETHALIHSEISEATEAVRSLDHSVMGLILGKHYLNYEPDEKPEGEAVELADAIIRIADYFGSRGWDLEKTLRLKMNYNKNRTYRHGNKKY